jgi:phage gpG-like protein
MSAHITVNDVAVLAALKKAAARMADLTPVMRLAGEVGTTSILRNFEDGGRPAWKPLSETTIRERKKARKWPGRVLVRSGQLRRIHTTAGALGVVFSAPAKYAAVHQFGARRGESGTVQARVRAHKRAGRDVRAHVRNAPVPWGDIPARPFLVLQDEDLREIARAAEEYILTANGM